MPSKNQSRRFCFTWNNYSNDVITVLSDFYQVHCNYLVYGKEVGASGTPHLQGFFTLKKKKLTIAALRNLGLACHLEVAKGDSLQCSQYCKKDNDFEEFGITPTPGQRTDLAEVADMVKQGKSITEIADAKPVTFMRYGRGIRDLKLVLATKYEHDSVRGIWYYGLPGTGKSYRARQEYPHAYIKAQNKWFDGYAGEDAIILDDLDTHLLGHHLKIWADRYSHTGETKGGTVQLRHKVFVVTSNYHPNGLFECPVLAEAIIRRFKLIHIDKPPKFNIPT